MCIYDYIYIQGVIIYFLYYLQYYSVNYQDFLSNFNTNNNFNYSNYYENNNSNINNSNNINNLTNENQKLRTELNTYKNENDQLKNKISKLSDENNKLKTELNEAKNTISNLNKNQISQKENEEILSSLNKIIENQDKEINDLKNKLKDLNKTIETQIPINKSYNLDDIIVIHFKSIDQQIDCAIKCVRSDTFAEVEEKLYQIYDEYRERNNNFLFQGRTILRFKKIYENNIKDGDKVQLIYDE